MSTAAIMSVEGLVKTFHTGFLGALPGVGGLAARLQLKGVAQRVEAVRGVTFRVERGEVFGLVGPNGAGKTTTIKALMGLIRPTAGTGTLLGHPLGHTRSRERLGYLPEQPYFYEYLNPREFLDFYGGLFPMTARERRARAEQLIDRVGLRHAVDRPIRRFSKGMVQRIGIAQALINDPELIVLDEPMSGLDPIGRKEVRDLVLELKAQGKTVFFSSHILQDVEQLCDRVAIVVKGKVRAEGRLGELLLDADHPVEIVSTHVGSAARETVTALCDRVMDAGETVRFHLRSVSDRDAAVQALVTSGARLQSVTPQRRSLEDLFVEEAGRA